MSSIPRPEYPRMQFRREDSWLNLNGEWRCRVRLRQNRRRTELAGENRCVRPHHSRAVLPGEHALRHRLHRLHRVDFLCAALHHPRGMGRENRPAAFRRSRLCGNRLDRRPGGRTASGRFGELHLRHHRVRQARRRTDRSWFTHWTSCARAARAAASSRTARIRPAATTRG